MLIFKYYKNFDQDLLDSNEGRQSEKEFVENF